MAGLKINRWSTSAIFAVLLLTLTLLPIILSRYWVGILTLILVYGIFAASLDLILGYTGLPSLGHAASFGVAAYIGGILDVRLAHNFGISLGLGMVAAVLIAAVFGLVSLRAKTHYFLLITLALAQMLWAVAFRWRSMTGGDDGYPGIARPDLSIIPWDMSSPTNYYHFTLIIFVLAVVSMYIIVKSPFGHVLQGIRESEDRMTVLGYNTWLYKFVAVVLAGFFSGLAGMLHMYYNQFVSPQVLSATLSTEVLLMVVAGGAGTLFGPLLGATVIVLLSNLVSAFTERWLLIMGGIYVSVALFAPEGIWPLVRNYVRRWLPS